MGSDPEQCMGDGFTCDGRVVENGLCGFHSRKWARPELPPEPAVQPGIPMELAHGIPFSYLDPGALVRDSPLQDFIDLGSALGPHGAPMPDDNDDDFQPLPDFDNVVVPDTQPYTCAECGQRHEAKLVGMRPLGDMKIQLQYRADVCPRSYIDIALVKGGPVVREADDA